MVHLPASLMSNDHLAGKSHYSNNLLGPASRKPAFKQSP